MIYNCAEKPVLLFRSQFVISRCILVSQGALINVEMSKRSGQERKDTDNEPPKDRDGSIITRFCICNRRKIFWSLTPVSCRRDKVMSGEDSKM